jgi:leucyl aminopeptidase
MEVSVDTTNPAQLSVDALAVIGWEAREEHEQKGNEAQPVHALPVDEAVAQQDGWLAELRSAGEFTGKLYEITVLHRPKGLAAKRLAVVGGGKQEKFGERELRRLAAVIVRHLQAKGVRTVALQLPAGAGKNDVIAALEGAILGGWNPDKYKSDKKKEKPLVSFTVAVPEATDTGLAEAAEHARIVAESQNFTRDLVNEPANILTTTVLAEAAREMAAQSGLTCKILDRDAIAQLGMGALLGVAQGSDNPPYLVVLEYRPSRSEGGDQLALVGKGVTFDTGGISIKPCDGMEKMKYDMAGAAAVFGAMRAIAQLKPSVPVTGYTPIVENMINGHAQRPGDIVRALSGKTIEVLNTDAEGRLILADALTYATRNGATHIVDAATLTGAIGVALGHFNMGAFTNNEGFLQEFMAAARAAGEKAWQMPLEEEYKEYLKSAFADLPNIGGRHGGSITAAWFLREFVDPTPWVHLDIASTAWLDDAKPWSAKGPTGVGVRSFVQLALDWPAR